MSACSLTLPFRSSWIAHVLQAPPLIMPARHFFYPQAVPDEEQTLREDALLVEVTTALGGSFLIQAARGFQAEHLPTGVWSCPNADEILLLAGGYAYLSNTLTPEHCSLLPQRPVASVLPVPEAELILLAGFENIMAIGAEGVRWSSQRLSWEGVEMDEVRNGKLYGKGWNLMEDRMTPFELDLGTGFHTGGGFRAQL